MGVGMPGHLSRAANLRQLDNVLNYRRGDVLAELDELGPGGAYADLMDLLTQTQASLGLFTPSALGWTDTNWFGDPVHRFKGQIPPRAIRMSIFAEAYRKALAMAGSEKYIHSLHVCAGRVFEVYLAESEVQVTVLIMTPPATDAVEAQELANFGPYAAADSVVVVAPTDRIDAIVAEFGPNAPVHDIGPAGPVRWVRVQTYQA